MIPLLFIDSPYMVLLSVLSPAPLYRITELFKFEIPVPKVEPFSTDIWLFEIISIFPDNVVELNVISPDANIFPGPLTVQLLKIISLTQWDL